MAKLFLLPDAPGNEPLEIIESMVLIGRSAETTLQVEDTNVSKFHALLIKTEDGYRLFDLYSANGTYVNDQRITTSALSNKDIIRFGTVMFRFECEAGLGTSPQPSLASKVRLKTGPTLGRKPVSASAPTSVASPVAKPPSGPIPIPAAPPSPPSPAAVTPSTPTPSTAAGAATLPKPVTPILGKKEEPLVSIRIPESKKTLLTPSAAGSDAKETQATHPVVPAALPATEPEAKPRLGLGLKRPTPAPASVPATAAPAPAAAPGPAAPAPAAASTPTKPRLGLGFKKPAPAAPAPAPAEPAPAAEAKPIPRFAPQPPQEVVPSPAAPPEAAPPPPPASATEPPPSPSPAAPSGLGAPKPLAGERSLRPKLGGAGGGGGGFKLKK